MAKRRRQRLPAWLQSLKRLALSELHPRTTANAATWRYTIIVPVEQVKPTAVPKASLDDLEDLRVVLVYHFGGVTQLPLTPGYGLRDPGRPDDEPELNINRSFVVYAAPLPEADRYFQELQQILQDHLEEGVILIEKQELVLL